jgi:ubiquinone/menaquinone biosynthesis C-methylase UbiE
MPEEWTRDKLLLVGRDFMLPRILLTAGELDLFSKLKGQPKSVADLCRTEEWNERGLAMLLDALAAYGLLIKTSDANYSLPESVERLLVKDSNESILPMILHGCRLWDTWSHLTHIVRTGENPNTATDSVRSADETKDFIEAMDVVGRVLGGIVADSIDLASYRRMLDIGGGSGTYTMAFLKKAPQMTATLFDLPEVTELAKRRLAGSEFSQRVRLVSGDYNKDPFPTGHDLALLSAVIHINSRQGNQTLFRRVYECLDPGGTILIRDHIMDPSRTRPVGGAVFAINMLVNTKGGSTYTYDEVRQDLEQAGFKDVRMIREGKNMDQLVSGTK